MKNRSLKLPVSILFIAVLMALACGKSKKSKKDDQTTSQTQTLVSGQLVLGPTLRAGTPTHVVAINTESNWKKSVVAIGSDGTFSLPIEKGSPSVLAYVDSTKTGSAMLVSKFGAGSLDTLAPSASTSQDITLGTVDASSSTASSSTSTNDLVTAMGITTATADTLGAVDDIGLRNINPDIDNNGVIDAQENKNIILDFHNRFQAKNGSTSYFMDDMKNQFLPDSVTWEYTGSGVVPELEKSWFTSAPTTYSWKFSAPMTMNSNCDGSTTSGNVHPADTACNRTFDPNSEYNRNYQRYQLSVEVKPPADGTYTLTVADKTYTWTNIKVSDFSAGKGFIALFIKFNVNSDNRLTGFDWKWQKKGANNSYSLASQEELDLLVKGDGGFLSLKIDDTSKNLGVIIGKQPTGSFNFLTAAAGINAGGVELQNINISEINSGLLWTRVNWTTPGISYDDKLGMRFFF